MDEQIRSDVSDTYFTVWTNDVGFTDKLCQFNAFYKLGRSLNYFYVHSPLQSPRSSLCAFDFVGLNQYLSNSARRPIANFSYLDIPIGQPLLEKTGRSFDNLQNYIRKRVAQAQAQTSQSLVVRFGIGTGGRDVYPIIHKGCSCLPDEVDLFTIYREARRLEPRQSLFTDNKIRVLVHMRQGDTAVIETPGQTFISVWNAKPKEYMQEFDSFEQLSKDHIEVEPFYDFALAFQLQFEDQLSLVFCSDGYRAAFDDLFQKIETFHLDDQRMESLQKLREIYDYRKYSSFNSFSEAVVQVGETDQNFCDLVNSAIEAEIIVTGTQQTMIVQLLSRFYDLRRPKIILMLHRGGMIPDRQWHDLPEDKAILILVDVENYDIREVTTSVRRELLRVRGSTI